jgi:undecaprenyl-diphosphatase
VSQKLETPTNTRTKFPISLDRKTIPILAVAGLFALLLVFLREFKLVDEWLSSAAVNSPRGGVPLALFFSFLGSTPFVIAVAAAWAAIEAVVFRRRDRALLMLASLIALPMYELGKILVKRARPVTEFVARSGLHGDSFPSGHSAGSFAVYATLAYLLYRQLPRRWGVPLASALVGLIIVIGISRVYLGAHFPTDVLGGWLIGLFVLLGIRQGVAYYEEQHHTREKV